MLLFFFCFFWFCFFCVRVFVLNFAYVNIYAYIYSNPTRRQLYGHLPHITKTIQVRRARHAGHCWRSKDELVSDVLLWTPTYGQARAGRPARTYIQQLCEDTGCNPEDLPEAMNDREKWRERVKDIRAGGTTWWWWWWYILRKHDLIILFVCLVGWLVGWLVGLCFCFLLGFFYLLFSSPRHFVFLLWLKLKMTRKSF